jgi:hypothetical protein
MTAVHQDDVKMSESCGTGCLQHYVRAFLTINYQEPGGSRGWLRRQSHPLHAAARRPSRVNMPNPQLPKALGAYGSDERGFAGCE